MATSPGPTTTPTHHVDIEEALSRLDALAHVMDRAVTLPGTKVALGFDALLGLVPVIGDAISGVISSYLIWEARRLGASRLVIARMAGNAAIDTVLGSVPLVGDIFDVGYKANTRNVALLRNHLKKKVPSAGGPYQTIDGDYIVQD